MIIRVPVGTVVREVRWEVEGEVEKEQEERLGMTWAWEASKVRLGEAEKREKRWDGWKRAKDLAAKEGREENDEPFRELEEIDVGKHKQEALERWRKELFVTYPLTDLASHPSFLASEHNLLSKLLSRASAHPGKKTRRRKSPLPSEDNPPLLLDLVQPTPIADPILLLSGGTPGLGNPSFQTTEDRSPKYATRGGEGDTMRLELEVKSGGEVGLVGAPNAGKSYVPSHPTPFHLTLTPYIRTILRALTSSTPRVAAYPFTTLNPHHGTCVLYSDSTFSGPRTSSPISNTSSIPETFSATSSHPNRLERRATLLPAPVRKEEVLRFTITDNPGLVPLSSLNVGLGHAFLRHVERCSALVYVVDLSAVDPVGALESVRKELREYGRMKGLGNEGEERGLEGRVKGVVANKADLFGEFVGREGEEEEDVDGVSRKSREEGERKLGELISYVREMERSEIEEGKRGEGEEEGIWVVPLSAKKRENVGALVKKLESTVRAERRRTIERIEREEQEAREDEEEEARRLE
jgi:GTP-binding protein